MYHVVSRSLTDLRFSLSVGCIIFVAACFNLVLFYSSWLLSMQNPLFKQTKSKIQEGPLCHIKKLQTTSAEDQIQTISFRPDTNHSQRQKFVCSVETKMLDPSWMLNLLLALVGFNNSKFITYYLIQKHC